MTGMIAAANHAPGAPGLQLFCLDASRAFGEGVARHLGCELAPVEEREFGDGEHKARPLAEVGGRDVYVIQSLGGGGGGSPNDKLLRLLFFIGALRDAGAGRITAVVPYLAYSRKDRRTKPRDPVTTRYVASLFEAVGTDAIVTLEVHNLSAFENAFRRCRAEHVPVAGLFAEFFSSRMTDGPITVVSPDAGGAKRAALFRHELQRRTGRDVKLAMMEKRRSGGLVSGSLFCGEVAGATAIIVDDMISSGTTLVRAAAVCLDRGAKRVIAAAAHGLFTGGAPELFGPDGPDEVVVTNSVPLDPEVVRGAADNLTVVDASPLVADLIVRLHRGDAACELLPFD